MPWCLSAKHPTDFPPSKDLTRPGKSAMRPKSHRRNLGKVPQKRRVELASPDSAFFHCFSIVRKCSFIFSLWSKPEHLGIMVLLHATFSSPFLAGNQHETEIIFSSFDTVYISPVFEIQKRSLKKLSSKNI